MELQSLIKSQNLRLRRNTLEHGKYFTAEEECLASSLPLPHLVLVVLAVPVGPAHLAALLGKWDAGGLVLKQRNLP